MSCSVQTLLSHRAYELHYKIILANTAVNSRKAETPFSKTSSKYTKFKGVSLEIRAESHGLFPTVLNRSEQPWTGQVKQRFYDTVSIALFMHVYNSTIQALSNKVNRTVEWAGLNSVVYQCADIKK